MKGIYFVLFVNLKSGGGGFVKDLRLFMYPSGICIYVLLPLFFGWFYRYFSVGSKKALIFTVVIAVIIATTHLFYLILICSGLVSFLFFFWFCNRRDKKVIKKIKLIFRVLGLIIIVLLPYLLLRLNNGLEINDLASYGRGLSLERGNVIPLGSEFFIIEPRRLLYIGRTIYTPLFIISILFVPVLLARFKHKSWAILLVSLILIPPIIFFNPVLIYLLEKVIGLPKIVRYMQIAPVYYIIPFFVWWAFVSIKNKIKMKNFNQFFVAFLLLLLVCLSSPFNGFVSNMKKADKYEREYVYNINFPSKKVINYLKSYGKSSVVAASPSTSMKIAMNSPSFIVSTCLKHGSAIYGVEIAQERLNDAEKILRPNVDTKTTIMLLKKYQVKYILVSKRNRLKFNDRRYFEKILRDQNYILYKYK